MWFRSSIKASSPPYIQYNHITFVFVNPFLLSSIPLYLAFEKKTINKFNSCFVLPSSSSSSSTSSCSLNEGWVCGGGLKCPSFLFLFSHLIILVSLVSKGGGGRWVCVENWNSFLIKNWHFVANGTVQTPYSHLFLPNYAKESIWSQWIRLWAFRVLLPQWGLSWLPLSSNRLKGRLAERMLWAVLLE